MIHEEDSAFCDNLIAQLANGTLELNEHSMQHSVSKVLAYILKTFLLRDNRSITEDNKLFADFLVICRNLSPETCRMFLRDQGFLAECALREVTCIEHLNRQSWKSAVHCCLNIIKHIGLTKDSWEMFSPDFLDRPCDCIMGVLDVVDHVYKTDATTFLLLMKLVSKFIKYANAQTELQYSQVMNRLVGQIRLVWDSDLLSASEEEEFLNSTCVILLKGEAYVWRDFQKNCLRSKQMQDSPKIIPLMELFSQSQRTSEFPILVRGFLKSACSLTSLPVLGPHLKCINDFLNLLLNCANIAQLYTLDNIKSMIPPLLTLAHHSTLKTTTRSLLHFCCKKSISFSSTVVPHTRSLSFSEVLEEITSDNGTAQKENGLVFVNLASPAIAILERIVYGFYCFLHELRIWRDESVQNDAGVVAEAAICFAAIVNCIARREWKTPSNLLVNDDNEDARRDLFAHFRRILDEYYRVPGKRVLSTSTVADLREISALSIVGRSVDQFLEECNYERRMPQRVDTLQLLKQAPPAMMQSSSMVNMDRTFDFLEEQERDNDHIRKKPTLREMFGKDAHTSSLHPDHHAQDYKLKKDLLRAREEWEAKRTLILTHDGSRGIDSRSTDFSSSTRSYGYAQHIPVSDAEESRRFAFSASAPEVKMSNIVLDAIASDGKILGHMHEQQKLQTRQKPSSARIATDPRSKQQVNSCSLEDVSIDAVLERLLMCSMPAVLKSAEMWKIEPPTANSESIVPIPLRFMNEESYLSAFVPLVEAEVWAAILANIKVNGENRKRGHGSDAPSGEPAVEKISAVKLTPRKGSDERMQEISYNGRLQKDDLVLVLKKTKKGLASPPMNLASAVKDLPHYLGVVLTSARHNAREQPIPGVLLTLAGVGADGVTRGPSEDFIFHTSRTGEQNSDLICIPVFNLATFIREFYALYSMKQAGLVPLAPYLLVGRAVASDQMLCEQCKNLEDSFHRLKNMAESSTLEAKQAAEFSKLELVCIKLQKMRINGSVLRSSSIGRIVKRLGTNKQKFLPSHISKLFTDLRDHWMNVVKQEAKENLVGGKIVPVDQSLVPAAVPAPMDMSPVIWQQLQRTNNLSQIYAIKYVCDQFTNELDTRISLVQGPPGCGKSHCIIGMITALLNKPLTQQRTTNKTKILLCTPSNSACDELLLRLLRGIYGEHGTRTLAIVRLGENLDKAPQDVQALLLEKQVEAQLQQREQYLQREKCKLKMQNLQGELAQLNNSADSGNSRHRSSLKQQIADERRKVTSLDLLLDHLRVELRRCILDSAEVIASTLSSAGRQQFVEYLSQNNVTFSTVIIDESAQVTEPSALIPLRYGAKNLVMVGDPRQLPATVLSRIAVKNGLGRSLFERLESCGHEVFMLNVQYRMHPDIRSFPSMHFYQSRLVDAEVITDEVAAHPSATPEARSYCLFENPEPSNPRRMSEIKQHPFLVPLSFIDLMSSQETRMGQSGSYSNQRECEYIVRMVGTLKSHPTLKHRSVSIIAPYSAQVKMIQSQLENAYQSHKWCSDVEVNSVDGFQGRERDIIIFSCVRTDRSIGFLADARRLCVGITRAKGMLCIVGSVNALKFDNNWAALLTHLQQRELIFSVNNAA